MRKHHLETFDDDRPTRYVLRERGRLFLYSGSDAGLLLRGFDAATDSPRLGLLIAADELTAKFVRERYKRRRFVTLSPQPIDAAGFLTACAVAKKAGAEGIWRAEIRRGTLVVSFASWAILPVLQA